MLRISTAKGPTGGETVADGFWVWGEMAWDDWLMSRLPDEVLEGINKGRPPRREGGPVFHAFTAVA